MQAPVPTPCRRLAFIIAGTILAGCASGPESGVEDRPRAIASQEPAPAHASTGAVPTEDVADARAIFEDPVFRKQFVASYGINSETEPRITQEEIAILEKIRPLMAESPAAAEQALLEHLKPDGSAHLDFTLGSLRFQQDKNEEASASFRKAVEKFPGFRRAWRNLGLSSVKAGRYDEAIRAFTRMVELGGGDAYAFGLLGFAYASKQDYQPAEAAYRSALLLQPDNTEWRLGLTRCVFKQEKFEEASALLDALIERYPDKADFWLLQAHTFLAMKQALKAAQNLEVVDRLGKSTVDSLFTLGDIYLTEGLPDLAARSYGRAIGLNEQQPPARPLRSAESLAAKGAIAEARNLTTRIREVSAKHLAGTELMRLLKLEARLTMAEGTGGAEAAKTLEEILRLDPVDGEALMLLGEHYDREKQPDRALFYYERAGSIEAFEVNAKVHQAQVLVGLGRHSEAVPLLRRAQELKPRESVARYLEQVERIAKSRR